jgi:integral membrane protein (TIGR00529 family)
LALLSPMIALGISLVVLAVMLYKRVAIGVALTTAALLLSLLSLDLLNEAATHDVLRVILDTTRDPVTISLVAVIVGIMLLSLLYRETRFLDKLSQSFSGLVGNPRLTVSTLPAIIGLLPVPGGALMSAPLLEGEAEKLGWTSETKTYVNVWFRHVIFPIYPMSQVLILTAALTGASITSIILRQIPVVIAMVIIGYFVALRTPPLQTGEKREKTRTYSNLKNFLIAFSPITLMIFVVVVFNIDVAVAAFIGILFLLLITRPSSKVLWRSVSNKGVYSIALAAYGAMLLRNATMASGASDVLGQILATGNVHSAILLSTVPAALSFMIGSPSGGIAVSVPIVAGTLSFSAGEAGLLYICAYLGYLAAPTHLCLVLTADYFKCRLNRLYRLLVPSVAIAFAVSFIIYFVL